MPVMTLIGDIYKVGDVMPGKIKTVIPGKKNTYPKYRTCECVITKKEPSGSGIPGETNYTYEVKE